jgi:hypothetical protein
VSRIYMLLPLQKCALLPFNSSNVDFAVMFACYLCVV